MDKLDWMSFQGQFHQSWWRFMQPAIESPWMFDIYQQLKSCQERICPGSDDTFRSFSWDYENIKTVLVLSDPYPWIKNRKIVSDGLPMSCSKTGILQPSLVKFYEAMERELDEVILMQPDLSYLSERGVFLINTALTCKLNKVGSHRDLWLPLMQYLFDDVLNLKTGIVYWLMGAEAERVERWINPLGNYILKTSHPASAKHNEQDWDSKGMFKLINKILKSNNGEDFQVKWNK